MTEPQQESAARQVIGDFSPKMVSLTDDLLHSPLDEPVVNAVQHVAASQGATMAQVALAWVLTDPAATAPTVGSTKAHQLPEAVAALDLRLTDDEIRSMEQPYTPHGPSWF